MDLTTTPFRFGLVALPRSGAAWAETARRVEDLGFDSLLVPDNLAATSSMVACTAAASVTTALVVGPYVLAAPLRTPGLVAADAAALHALSAGRVELGLGAGRPDSEREAAELDLPFGSPGARVRHLERTVRAVRERTPDLPITVAAAGPRMLALAGSTADVVALGAPPFTDESTLAAMAATVLEAAGNHARDVVLNVNLVAVGERVPPWLEQRMGLTMAALREAGAATFLSGGTDEMVDTLQRRRATTGVSYVCAGAEHADLLAPVVERLRGR